MTIPDILLVVPVRNEEKILENSIAALIKSMPQSYSWEILISNNGSTDRTAVIGADIEKRYENVRFISSKKQGRGHALQAGWNVSEANFLLYCDADLSTDPRHISDLIGELDNGADIAIGSRYGKKSESKRDILRLVLSKGYNHLAGIVLRTKIKDRQCGFKALNRQTAVDLLPEIEDTGWFFDTELLTLAEKRGYNIREVPVSWKESLPSSVNLPETVFIFLKGLFSLRRRLKNSHIK